MNNGTTVWKVCRIENNKLLGAYASFMEYKLDEEVSALPFALTSGFGIFVFRKFHEAKTFIHDCYFDMPFYIFKATAWGKIRTPNFICNGNQQYSYYDFENAMRYDSFNLSPPEGTLTYQRILLHKDWAIRHVLPIIKKKKSITSYAKIFNLQEV